MKTAIFLTYLFSFGLAFPYWIGGRTRGNVTLMCVVAPWIAFLCGWFAK